MKKVLFTIVQCFLIVFDQANVSTSMHSPGQNTQHSTITWFWSKVVFLITGIERNRERDDRFAFEDLTSTRF